ncbi:hypothetical protein GW17_00051865 [Ensete ventricosum]|nr:hypothetical protein GW17_00051865 [Ensete ventricosum]
MVSCAVCDIRSLGNDFTLIIPHHLRKGLLLKDSYEADSTSDGKKECSGASRATLLLGGVRQQFRGQLVVAWRRASSPFPVSRPYLLLHQTDFPEPLLPSSSPSPDSPVSLADSLELT